ncbi:MAG TPA: hypothetical protein VFW83_07525 [Bryobacteraceae bacterium]|nr:hypothetical protein [Bryobacteraceae bacterium]
MSRLYTIIVMAGVFLATVPLASAQFRNRGHYDSRAVSNLIDRVHLDLNHAYSVYHFSSDDHNRLNDAEKNLREFAQKWDKGHFDKDQLDDVISSIQHVLDNNKLPTDVRDAISSDVQQLRAMREAYSRHEIGAASPVRVNQAAG